MKSAFRLSTSEQGASWFHEAFNWPRTVRVHGAHLHPPFKGDLVEASLALNATTQTTALLANYGLTNRWDAGLAVPFVRVNLAGC
jgi:hypothetical protein